MTNPDDQTLSVCHIIKEGVTKSIYDEDVSFEDIANYFRERMKYVSIKIPSEVYSLESIKDITNAKFGIFNHLVGLLETVSRVWNNTGGIDPPVSSDISEDSEDKVSGEIYH